MRPASIHPATKPARKLLHIAGGFFLLLFLLAISYILLFPLLKMVSDALKPESDFYDPSVVWLSKSPTLENFKLAYEMVRLPVSLGSTLVYQMVSAALEIGVCSMVAYGMARFVFWESRILKGILLLTILIPLPMLMIPMTVNYSHLDFLGLLELLGKVIGQELRPNLLGTVFAFWLPSVLGVGLPIFPRHPTRTGGGGLDRRCRPSAHLSVRYHSVLGCGLPDGGTILRHLALERHLYAYHVPHRRLSSVGGDFHDHHPDVPSGYER